VDGVPDVSSLIYTLRKEDTDTLTNKYMETQNKTLTLYILIHTQANPPHLDGVPDMSSLIYLEAPNVLHNLDSRYLAQAADSADFANPANAAKHD
jgi:myosin heavy subunit